MAIDVPPALLFWNTQLIQPVKQLSEDSMSSRIERLSNGIYVHTARILDGYPRPPYYCCETIAGLLPKH